MKHTLSTRGNRARRSIGRAICACLLLGLVATAQAGQPAVKVVRGQVQFTQQGDTLLIQASNRSIINFRSFSVPAGQTVQYVLPSDSARVLTRVTGGQASHIDGVVLCNGRLYLVNPAGVFFGATAAVSAAAVCAVAGDLADRDFLRRVDRFSNIAGQVVNEGSLQGQAVHLIGRQVNNGGSIVAPDGVVTMTAADGQVLLGELDGHVLVKIGTPAASAGQSVAAPAAAPTAGPAGALAAGDMYSLAVQNTGQVQARRIDVGGRGARVEVGGSLDASQPGGRGGDVRITGQSVALVGANVSASGRDGGGQVQVTGGSRVFISADSTISADATGCGDGGRIVITAGDYTGVHGTLTARGGSAGGNGGFVETSGGKLELTLAPDVSAAAGQAGTWLLDPHDIRIAPADGVPWSPNNAAQNGFGSQVGSDGNWNTWNVWPAANATGVSTLPIETIMMGLMHASTVIVRTSPGGTGKGDITWDMSGSWRLNLDTLGSQDCPIGVDRKLILMAHHDITVNFNAGIQTEQSATGSFQLLLVPNFDGQGGGQVHLEALDRQVRHVISALRNVPDIAVPPDAPERSLKDIVIVRSPAPANTVPPTNSDVPDRSAGQTNQAPEGDQSDSFKKDASGSQVQIKLAESGALDATRAVSVRAVGATTRPALKAGDEVGLRTTNSRIP